MNNIVFRELCPNGLQSDFLEDFDRNQVTNRAWVDTQGELSLKDVHFIDDWDKEKKGQVISTFKNSFTQGGFVIGSYEGEKLIGFACLEGSLLGSHNEYLELSYLHVTRIVRNQGVGKQLFAQCCEKAKIIGAKKLYIAAHPSEESQFFYHSVGCVRAAEINTEILAREPLDIQLEFIL